MLDTSRNRHDAPVANEMTPWGKALEALLVANERADLSPSNWSELAAALEAHPDSTQTAASWRTTIKRIRWDKEPTDRMAKKIAAALGIPRDQLPPSAEKPTLLLLQGHLEAVGAKVEFLLGREHLLTLDLDDARARLARLETARRPSPGEPTSRLPGR